jgi:hypothetical protein
MKPPPLPFEVRRGVGGGTSSPPRSRPHCERSAAASARRGHNSRRRRFTARAAPKDRTMGAVETITGPTQSRAHIRREPCIELASRCVRPRQPHAPTGAQGSRRGATSSSGRLRSAAPWMARTGAAAVHQAPLVRKSRYPLPHAHGCGPWRSLAVAATPPAQTDMPRAPHQPCHSWCSAATSGLHHSRQGHAARASRGALMAVGAAGPRALCHAGRPA